MPPRISRSSIPISKPNNPRKGSRKRTLNAFSIAARDHPENPKVRRHRLGEIEDDGPPLNKKRRIESNDDELEESGEERRSHSKYKRKLTLGNSDIEEGSDSEGNTWTLGHVDEDEDTEVDSDEAFGESDEEKFDGWTFRGSSSRIKSKKVKHAKAKLRRNGDAANDLDEPDIDGNSDDDSLGGDAIDMATALDQYNEPSDNDSQEDTSPERPKLQLDSESEEGADMEDEDMESQYSMSEEDEDDTTEKLARIQDLVNTLHPADDVAKRKERRVDAHETRMPSATGISGAKFDINDLLAMPSTDSQSKESLRALKAAQKVAKKAKVLQPTLPKRQKDKLDRIAANAKANEALARWVDTVKHNRRAEYLSFPLEDPEASGALGVDKLLPTSSRAPFNDLEGAIQKILHESGLSTGKADVEEDQIREFEELQANRMSIEEVQARRAELRKARELLFREEVRAKRIKKIKSKSYRRVHRKERERLAALERDQFADGGSDVDEEEQERMDRRRAEERMGAKHRDSKWAKQMKKSGRAIWDEDARSGVTDMAKRNEELRRRIEGKSIQNEDGEGSDSLSSEDEQNEDDSDENDDEAQSRLIRRKLDRLTEAQPGATPTSGLSFMKFMRRAEAALKAQNDEDIERMRRQLAGEDSIEESEDETIGRKLFGPSEKASTQDSKLENRNEFEELSERESDDGDLVIAESESAATALLPQAFKQSSKVKAKTKEASTTFTKSSQSQSNSNAKRGLIDKAQTLPKEKYSEPDADGWQTVSYERDSDAEEEAVPENNEALIRELFAGDDVEAEFEAEKKATIDEEDEKMIDNTLPGWGNWVGDGLSKREQKRNKGRFLTKQEGIKPQDRKDAKLKNVIINQKRLKKTVGYLASTLPFPFTTKAEYERSIRMPIGQEWNVKETYQDNTKPKLLIKPGRIIAPMEKPMV